MDDMDAMDDMDIRQRAIDNQQPTTDDKPSPAEN